VILSTRTEQKRQTVRQTDRQTDRQIMHMIRVILVFK